MTSFAFDPDNGGAIGRTLRWIFGRSWRTSVLGLIAFVSTIITAAAAMQDAPSPVVKWAPLAAQALTALAVMITKDARIHGEDRPAIDPSLTPPALDAVERREPAPAPAPTPDNPTPPPKGSPS